MKNFTQLFKITVVLLAIIFGACQSQENRETLNQIIQYLVKYA